jgi:hypothetical protein
VSRDGLPFSLVAKQRKPTQRNMTGIDVRISELSGRVFQRLATWAKMALIATVGLGALTFALGLAASTSLRSFPMVAIFLIIVLIPAIAALIIGRRAKAIHASVDGIGADIRTAMNDPEIRHLFDNFLDGNNDADDGRAGLARLAKGALGARKVVRQRRDSLVHLAAAVRGMVTAPGLLVTITVGMALLALFSIGFALKAIF